MEDVEHRKFSTEFVLLLNNSFGGEYLFFGRCTRAFFHRAWMFLLEVIVNFHGDGARSLVGI